MVCPAHTLERVRDARLSLMKDEGGESARARARARVARETQTAKLRGAAARCRACPQHDSIRMCVSILTNVSKVFAERTHIVKVVPAPVAQTAFSTDFFFFF